jgi:mannose-6-phosphate isomerase-like protein (cupin superfamily)
VSNYAVARFDEIDVVDDGREPMRPVRHHFGIQAFGVNTWTAAEVGDRIINEHDEADSEGHEELYFVHSGRARFEIDGETVEAPAGTFVFVQPAARRTAFAEEPDTTLVAMGGTPGKAYESHGLEIWAPLSPLFRAGEYAEAADRGRQLLADNPEYPGLFYNVACAESLAGRKDDALEHLRVAVEKSDQCRKLAAGDSDFDAIRDEPAFQELFADERQAEVESHERQT